MTTLYLDRKNLSLRADSSALVCYENDKRVATVPLKILQRVCIRGDLTLSAKVLGKLGETGIGVLILSGRQKRPALMLPNWKLDGQRRMAQYALSQDKSASLTAARNTVAAKLSAQLQHLQQMAFSDGLNADCLKEHIQSYRHPCKHQRHPLLTRHRGSGRGTLFWRMGGNTAPKLAIFRAKQTSAA